MRRACLYTFIQIIIYFFSTIQIRWSEGLWKKPQWIIQKVSCGHASAPSKLSLFSAGSYPLVIVVKSLNKPENSTDSVRASARFKNYAPCHIPPHVVETFRHLHKSRCQVKNYVDCNPVQMYNYVFATKIRNLCLFYPPFGFYSAVLDKYMAPGFIVPSTLPF